jgi:biotin carboxylase
MGDKAVARKTMMDVGVPTMPGSTGTIADEETVRLVTKNPEALHQIAAVLGALANTARASGSIPAAAAA